MTLSWIGGLYEGQDLVGFNVYGESTAGRDRLHEDPGQRAGLHGRDPD